MKTEDFKQGKKYRKMVSENKEIQRAADRIFRQEEIRLMTNLRRSYKSLFREHRNIKVLVNSLLDVLMVSTSYYERLTSMRSGMKELLGSSEALCKRAKNHILSQVGSPKLKKYERDELVQSALTPFVTLREVLENKVEILDDSLEYLDKLQFNLKTAVSTVKSNGGRAHGDQGGR